MSNADKRRVFEVVAAGLAILPALLYAQTSSGANPQEAAASHVRVVRLSYVSGNVCVLRPGSSEPEAAPVNTPLQEGFTLTTSGNSYAEAEFEDGSTARVGELSSMTFSQLARDAQGDTVTRMTFERGYATFHFLPERQAAYSVAVGDAHLTPEGKGEFRTDFIQGVVRLEVIRGSVEVVTPAKSAKVGENKTLEFLPGAGNTPFQIRAGIDKDDWDQWVDARDTQAQRALRDEPVKSQQGLYGWSDLDAYGEWADIPGSGYGWAPYVQTGWTPFSSGLWNWYPAMGWTWISNEPWGWLPYHCGQWDYDFAFGWFWMPQGGCGYWAPAMVNWFHGPGWIGWCPKSGQGHPGPSPPRPPHSGPGPRPGIEHPGASYITTVPDDVFQNRRMLSPRMVNHVEAGKEADRYHAPPPPNGAAAHPLTTPLAATRSQAAAGEVSSVGGTRHAPAPPSILMGGNAAQESALLQTHDHGSSSQPLRVVMGPTLGGEFAMLASAGEFRGSGFTGPLSYGWSGTVLLPHGHGASPHLSSSGMLKGGRKGHYRHGGGHWGGGGHAGHGGGHFGGGHFGGAGHSGGGGHR